MNMNISNDVNVLERGVDMVEKKVIPISSKRQITIPQKFFRSLGLDNEVDCLFNGKEIILKPVVRNDGYFAEQIVNQLIDEGYTGEEFKKEFARLNNAVRPGVKALIKDADNYAKEAMKNYVDETNEIFDLED